MKYRIAGLFVLFLPLAVGAQLNPFWGARLSYQTIFMRSAPDAPLSRFFRPGLQAGVFVKIRSERRLALRSEFNYSLKGYFLDTENKVGYNYLGLAAMPELHVAGPFSLAAGGFADWLILDPGDFPAAFQRRYIDAGLLASAFLRYGRFEIQARYQWSLTPFLRETGQPTLYFQSLGFGLGYYFR
jgi:hypothetical protein